MMNEKSKHSSKKSLLHIFCYTFQHTQIVNNQVASVQFSECPLCNITNSIKLFLHLLYKDQYSQKTREPQPKMGHYYNYNFDKKYKLSVRRQKPCRLSASSF